MKMKTFNKLGSVEVRWRYMLLHPYGEGRPGKRKLLPTFYDKINAAFIELWILSGLGPADRIISAGAYVPKYQNKKASKHTLGRAIDIDAIHWGGYSIVTKNYPRQQKFYLGCESVFRRYCGTVLGFLYNVDHHRHWHVDDGSAVCYRESSQQRVKYVQGSLKHVWCIDVGVIDGVAGKKTNEGIKTVSKLLGLKGPLTKVSVWQQYLMLTAVEGCRYLD